MKTVIFHKVTQNNFHCEKKKLTITYYNTVLLFLCRSFFVHLSCGTQEYILNTRVSYLGQTFISLARCKKYGTHKEMANILRVSNVLKRCSVFKMYQTHFI